MIEVVGVAGILEGSPLMESVLGLMHLWQLVPQLLLQLFAGVRHVRRAAAPMLEPVCYELTLVG